MRKHVRVAVNSSYRLARKLVVTLVGVTVILIGVAMIALPGPAIVVIPLGLAILGLEFAWARRLLHRVRERAEKVIRRGRSSGEAAPGTDREV